MIEGFIPFIKLSFINKFKFIPKYIFITTEHEKLWITNIYILTRAFGKQHLFIPIMCVHLKVSECISTYVLFLSSASSLTNNFNSYTAASYHGNYDMCDTMWFWLLHSGENTYFFSNWWLSKCSNVIGCL